MNKWIKSSFCGEAGNCIEVLYVAQNIVSANMPGSPENGVRTGETAKGDRICVKVGQSMRYATIEEWEVFIAGVKAGEFDLDKLQAA